ncbi:hypothetical protein [Glutamicibacter halophytocola]|uniref:HlyD family efflux transporter periplasmic adaptor subunit n=1 Tax=Glutamicibacter halophytocola TaxID=1933880 RepID=A0AA94XY25_9MICC|nr:hypothetical protein [Glutamicibacter halophytocola]UUX59303.1 hypothetical protein NUH22_01285 [Glutamicibacter halophytocola]
MSDPDPMIQGRSPLKRRLLWLLMAPAIAGLCTIGVFAAVNPEGEQVDSPTLDSLLVAKVEKGPVTDSLSVRGKIKRRNSLSVSDRAPDGQMVTMLPIEAGQAVRPGSVVAEISGRPVIFLDALLPMYRDLEPGDTGPDVKQLTEVLVELGYLSGSTEVYGPEVSAGVRGLYGKIGYDAPHASTEHLASLDALEKEVASQAEEPGLELPRKDDDLKIAKARAERALDQAKEDRKALIKKHEKELKVTPKAIEENSAQDPLSTGERAKPTVQESHAAPLDKNSSIRQYDAEIRSLDEQVATAQEEVTLAKVALEERQERRQLESSAKAHELERQEELAAQLRDAQAKADTPLPKNELIVGLSDEAVVAQVSKSVGDVADGEILVLGDTRLSVTATVPSNSPSELPETGSTIVVTAADGTIWRDGILLSKKSHGTNTTITIELPSADPEVEGTDVQLLIPLLPTSEVGLARVPRSAVITDTSGRNFIEIIQAGTRSEVVRLPVELGRSAAGMVELILEDDQLDLMERDVVLQFTTENLKQP